MTFLFGKWLWVARDLWRSASLTSYSKQDSFKVRSSSWKLCLTKFWITSRVKISQPSLWSTAAGWPLSLWIIFALYPIKTSLLQPAAVAVVPSQLRDRSGSAFSIGSERWQRSICILLFCQLKKPSCFSFSSYMLCSRAVTFFNGSQGNSFQFGDISLTPEESWKGRKSYNSTEWPRYRPMSTKTCWLCSCLWSTAQPSPGTMMHYRHVLNFLLTRIFHILFWSEEKCTYPFTCIFKS